LPQVGRYEGWERESKSTDVEETFLLLKVLDLLDGHLTSTFPGLCCRQIHLIKFWLRDAKVLWQLPGVFGKRKLTCPCPIGGLTTAILCATFHWHKESTSLLSLRFGFGHEIYLANGTLVSLT
jgi:hypothetical protein